MNELEDKLKAAVLAAALTEEKNRKRQTAGSVLRWAAPALAAFAVAALVLMPSNPKDTYDDPETAFAEVEKTFAYISQKIDQGSDIASKAEVPIETIKTLFK